MVGSRHWRALADQAGVADFVDYHDPDIAGSLRARGVDGVDVIIDAVGHTGGLEAVVPLLVSGGAVGIYGIEDLGERMGYLKILAASGVRVHGPGEYSEAEAHDAVVTLLSAGRLDAGLWFDYHAPTPLDRIEDAFAAIAARTSLKAVVRLTG